MQARFNYATSAPGVYDVMAGLGSYVDHCGLAPSLLHLVRLRASQLNGCAYCIDMHWKDARAAGEPEPRLYMLEVWRESSGYTDEERAALAWTEAVTLVADGRVADAVFEAARLHFTDKALSDLTLAVATINAWNRLSIAARTVPGEYQPAAAR